MLLNAGKIPRQINERPCCANVAVGLIHPINQSGRNQIDVSVERRKIFVSRDFGDFQVMQLAFFEEAACRFMPEVMESKVSYSRSNDNTPPFSRQHDGIVDLIEDATVASPCSPVSMLPKKIFCPF